MTFLFVVITAMIICMVIVPAMVRLAPGLGMIDQPDARKVHHTAIARVGGVGIVAGALISVIIWLPLEPLVTAYLLGSLVLFLFGAWDDSHELGHYTKFIGQFIAVFLVVFHGDLYVTNFPFLGLEPLSPAVGIPFTVIAMVGMINAINHSDGLDGLAGGESLLSLLAIAFLAAQADDPSSTVVLILACGAIGGVLGFLRFNAHPARVFMGDSGSQFLGFTLGVLAILLTQKTNVALSPALPALILGLPVVDILAVLWLRASSGQNWFRATRNHIHHRLLDLGFTHHETVVLIYAVQGFFVASALFLPYASDGLILSLYLGVCTLVFVLLTWAERRGWRAHREREGSRLADTLKSLRSHVVFKTGPVRFVSFAVALYLLGMGLFVQQVPRDFAIISTVLFLVLGIELLSGTYYNPVINRGIVFITALFIVYLGMQYPPPLVAANETMEIVFFSLLVLVIALTIKYARDVEFRTTPTDYLGVFLVLTVGLLPDPEFLGINLSIMIIKSMILLYGCELLIHRTRGGNRINSLNLASLGALAILAVRGLV